MDYYDFAVTQFTIHDTRALHKDTLYLSHSASVDGDVVASTLFKLGDFNNGTYNPQDYVSSGPGLTGVVINDPFGKVGFAFQLLNAGNVSDAGLSGRVAATADQLAGITAGLAGAGATGVLAALGSPAFPIGLAIEALANLWSWLTVDCDGPVAVDQLSGPRYLLDTWLDNPLGQIVFSRNYPGSDSATGCGGNSNYDATWLVRHYRGWGAVLNQTDGPLQSQTGVSAAAHNGAVHLFGTLQDGTVSHARTFTGAAWSIDTAGTFDLNASLAISAVSYNDRLWLFGVQSDGSVASLAYTEDGGSWAQEVTTIPGMQFTATQPIATAAHRHRLYAFARDQSGQLHATSSSDLALWNPWVVVPPVGLAPTSPVSGVALGGSLHLFGICPTNKPPGNSVVVHNATTDGSTWTGWAMVENGAKPLGQPTAQPVDVAATVFRDRVYLATRWQLTKPTGAQSFFMAVNFSGDVTDWSGWRSPESTMDFQPGATAGMAPLSHHLYIASPEMDSVTGGAKQVWAH